MSQLLKQLAETVAALKPKLSMTPEVGIILGTGLGGLAKEIKVEVSIDYADVPHFVQSTVESHHGMLHFGTLLAESA
jgi:purine-nucleoside phosphorylase